MLIGSIIIIWRRTSIPNTAEDHNTSKQKATWIYHFIFPMPYIHITSEAAKARLYCIDQLSLMPDLCDITNLLKFVSAKTVRVIYFHVCENASSNTNGWPDGRISFGKWISVGEFKNVDLCSWPLTKYVWNMYNVQIMLLQDEILFQNLCLLIEAEWRIYASVN